MNLDIGDTRLIISKAKKANLLRNQLAYVLATAYHETGFKMKPVRETFATSDDQAVGRLETAWAKGQLTWVRTPYWRKDSMGRSYFGRGYVQLTHKDNYIRAGHKLNLPLATNLDLALEPEAASDILVIGMLEGWFTGKKLEDYITLSMSDFTNARRIINGTESATKVSSYALKYDQLLLEEGYGVEDKTPEKTPGFLERLLEAINKWFGNKS